jgi:hypothetical protein
MPDDAASVDTLSVVVEFPDFGFGPATTAMRLIAHLGTRYPCTVASTGTALRFAQATLPSVRTVDVDTFSPDGMQRFAAVVDHDCLVLSVTNPPFASWATGRGYHVGVLDTLHWLWPEAAPVHGAEFYVAQRYWGHEGDRHADGEVLADPDRALPCERSAYSRTSSGRALVSFGGMSLPLDPMLSLDVAAWALAHVMPALLASRAITGVDIVGGHPLLASAAVRFTDDPRVRVLGMVTAPAYLELLATAEVVVATPGIATLHELEEVACPALLLPGHNVSQVLQLRDAVAYAGCVHAVEWPGAPRLAQLLRRLPEDAGTVAVAQASRRTIALPGSGTVLTAAVAQLLSGADGRALRGLGGSPALPRVSDVVGTLVGQHAKLARWHYR